MRSSSHFPRQAVRRLLGAVIAVGAVLSAGTAHADQSRQTFDPLKASEWNRLATVLLTPLNAPAMTDPTPPPPARESLEAAPKGWMGTVPRLSLVARDWGESRPLVGDLGLTDMLRTTRSSRMVVTRVHLEGGHLSPFMQLGLGEWRVDTTLLPSLPQESELAAQTGVGFELALSQATAVAFQADWTLLYPMQSSDVIARMHPDIWGSSVALRTRF